METDRTAVVSAADGTADGGPAGPFAAQAGVEAWVEQQRSLTDDTVVPSTGAFPYHR